MNLSSVGDKAVELNALTRLIERMIGERITRVEELPGGANSTVYLAAAKGETRYIVKRYPNRQSEEALDRLQTEYDGLKFLWNNGIRCISRPICRDSENRIGVYQYVQGRQLHAKEISSVHLEMAADFLKKLFLLKKTPDSSNQPLAAEACIRLRDYVIIVEKRYAKLSAISGNGMTTQLHLYLAEEFMPVFNKAKEMFREYTARIGLDPSFELPPEKRVLSPSDFGFHNGILTHEGRLVFIDFEYYGWDDPAKLIADFYLQPSVPLAKELRQYFWHELDFLTVDDPELIRRLPLAYVFSALKWCLLVLNCFLDCDREGRCLTDRRLLREKFALSRDILRTLEGEMHREQFPLNFV